MSLCLFNTRLIHPSEISYSPLSGISPRPGWSAGHPWPFTFPRAPAARACVTMFLHRHTRALIPSQLPLFMAHHRYAPPVFLFTQLRVAQVQIFVNYPQILLKSRISIPSFKSVVSRARVSKSR